MDANFLESVKENLVAQKEKITNSLEAQNTDMKNLVKIVDSGDEADVASDAVDRTLLDSLSDLYITDIPSELITLLIKEQINNISAFSIEKQNLVGYDGMGQTYSIPGMNLYVMIPNQESVVAASNKILEYMNS